MSATAVTASAAADHPAAADDDLRRPPSPPSYWRSLGLFTYPTTDPVTWTPAYKRLVVAIVAACNMLPGFCSTVYLPGTPNVRDDLHTTDVLVNLTLSLFILFNGVGPVLFSAFSDAFRLRRLFYLLALALFTAASIGCYFVGNIEGLIVLRCLQSIGASAPLSIGAGTISDMYTLSERGSAVGAMTAGSAIGPLMGPILGGVMTQTVGWRSTFLLSTGLGAALFLLQLLVVPESYRLRSVWGPMPVLRDLHAAPSATVPTNSKSSGEHSVHASTASKSDTQTEVVIVAAATDGTKDRADEFLSAGTITDANADAEA
ncbi:hypothetical protein HK405_000968, partial [Cladochytrium tenue]